MKKEKQPNRKKRHILPAILLAVLCIGGAELIACSLFAPEDFQRITAPARQAARSAAALCGELYHGAAAAAADSMGRAAQFWQDLTAPAEEEPEDGPEQLADIQEAGEPALAQDKPPVTDPLITELRQDGDRQILTGGVVNMVYFDQGSEEWANQPYGSDLIGGYGCGPTAMAMLVASLTREETDPAVMAQWAVDNGYWARKGGSWLSIVEGTGEAFGFPVESCASRSSDELLQTLFSGKLLVALMGPGHFTKRGHFIILRGATLTGEVLVADPNSSERSLTTWDPQLILDELSSNTNDGGPLWIVSVPEE